MGVSVGTSSAQTPLQQNFAGLKRYVADYVQGASDPDLLDVCGRGINAGIDVLNTRTWHWSVTSQDITLTASTQTYSLNANFKKPLKLNRLNSSSARDGWLDWKDPKTLLDEHPYSTQDGTPGWYTVINETDLTLLLDVPPAAAFVTSYPSLRLYYYRRLNHFADDNDRIGDLKGPPELWTFLGWYARWELAAVRGLPSGLVDRAFAAQAKMLKDLKVDDNLQQTDWQMRRFSIS